MSKIPVVKRVEINRTLLGKIEIRFECPRCKNSLICERKEIGTPDDCPHCNQKFMVSDEVERKLKAQENQKEQAKLEAQQKKELLRQQKIEQAERAREQKEQQRIAAQESNEIEFEEEEEVDFPEKQYESEVTNYSNLETIAIVVRFSAYISMFVASCVFLFQIYLFALAFAEEAYISGIVIMG